MGKVSFIATSLQSFDKGFTEMVVEWSSTNHVILVKPLNSIGCHGNRKAKFMKHIKTRGPLVLFRSPDC